MKGILKKLIKIICFFIGIIALLVLGLILTIKYVRWQKDSREVSTSTNGEVVLKDDIELEENVTCLFMGVNEALTDSIILGQYNPNTREVSLLSIPRDTQVNDTVDKKINSAYLGKYSERTIEKVKEVTGIEAKYYIIYNTKLLRKFVDEIGGVVVEVPFDMNYEDPYQDLYIHLKKGIYRMDGSQAEQFVRYRKGYLDQDISRITAQQKFIKATISRILEPQNIIKINELVKLVLDNSKTNITWDITANYIDDMIAFKTDRITFSTLPGIPGQENNIWYYFYDKKETQKMIDEMFKREVKIENCE